MTLAAVILEITKRVPRITRSVLLYRLFQFLCFPFILLYFAGRLLADGAYRSRFSERLGFVPESFTRTAGGCIWLHAVSVGEVASSIPLIRELRQARPDVPVYVSTSTVAGRRAADQKLRDLVDGVFYAPIDYVSSVRRVLRAIR